LHILRVTALLVAAASAAASAWARSAPVEGTLAPVDIRDLHYGDALFHFFQDDYFEAIVRTEAYGEQGRLGPHREDAELLLGGLYLSFGQHARAVDVFRRLLARDSVPPSVRSRAWFHVGKVLYARGYFEESTDALRQAGDDLPAALAAERGLLLAQGLMYRGRYDEAIASLEGWQAPPSWKAYGQFNLGVALVRAGRRDEGLRLLDQAGQVDAGTESLKALRDKANVALGYAQLQTGQPAAARAALDRVRLGGSQSSKALLGAGWADAAQEHYAEALTPWLELHGRGMLDAAVQESYLAVPYAYARLGADRQAAEYYESAIEAYTLEKRRLEESVESIRAGRMLQAVLASADGGGDGSGWFWQLSTLPDAPESRYLYHLLAGNEFQEALKYYRTLDFLERNLVRWRESLSAYADMVDARRRAYAERLPGAEQRLAQVGIEELDSRRDVLHARFAAADRGPAGAAALATEDELRLLDTIERVEAGLSARPEDPSFEDARDKARLARGALTWRLEATRKERAWRVRRALRELDTQLFDARTRYRAVTAAIESVPARNEEFALRIAAVRPRIEALSTRVVAVREQQGRLLAELAVRELEAQQARLDEYAVQARYALAALYDRALASAPQGGEP